jgi:hypothetical protein
VEEELRPETLELKRRGQRSEEELMIFEGRGRADPPWSTDFDP